MWYSSDVNEAPVNLTLSSTNVDENSPLGTPVGSLSSEDPDQPVGVHTYTIMGPVGVPFAIGGDKNRVLLVNGPLDHETNPIVLVIIRATDGGGLFVEKTFKITINGKFFFRECSIFNQECHTFYCKRWLTKDEGKQAFPGKP